MHIYCMFIRHARACTHRYLIPYSSTFRLASVVGEGDNFHILLKICPSAGEELQTLHEGVGRPQFRHLARISQIMRTTNGEVGVCFTADAGDRFYVYSWT